MDAETKTAFASVDARLDKLTEQGIRTAALLDRLAEEVGHLAEGQTRLTEQVIQLTARVDGFTQVVLRGFTEGAGRDIATDKRVDQIEARVAKLEQRT